MLLLIPQRYEFSSKSQPAIKCNPVNGVVADTTKVRIFKQITTEYNDTCHELLLLLIPQRYEFSSKSQQANTRKTNSESCCWYHKGTNFQANHNTTLLFRKLQKLLLIPQRYEFSSKSQPSITTLAMSYCCCWYHKGTNFQANHNKLIHVKLIRKVVADTTKVRIFKQITTQLYSFGSCKSCCWYHKGTNFQANHNRV